MKAVSVSINFYGLPLNVTGDYFKAEPVQWNAASGMGYPGSDAEFYVTSIKLEKYQDVDPESLLTHANLIDELGKKCVFSIITEGG